MSVPPTRKLTKEVVKAVVAGSIGNVVEWLDWAVYGLAAPFIAAQFFPAGDPMTALLQTYGVFAIGFLIRPIGAMVLGPYSDKHGRNKALALTILMMGGATGAIGLLPTYASIGIVAPFLIIALRLIQGFALGGEFGAATAFIYEVAPPKRRAFITSFRPCGTGLGFFIGSGAITLSQAFLSHDAMSAWGWRIPFIIAFFTALLGLYIRLKVTESPEFLDAKNNNETSQAPLLDSFRFEKKGMLVTFGFGMVLNSVFYVLYTIMPTYLKTIGVPFELAMKMNTGALFVYTAMIPVFGYLSDIVSKKLLLTVPCVAFIILAYPGFRLIGTGQFELILLVYILFTLLTAIFLGTFQVVLAEQFPTSTRTTAMAVSFNLHATLIGGTTPLFVTWLTATLDNPMAPAYCVMAYTACALIAVLCARYPSKEVQYAG